MDRVLNNSCPLINEIVPKLKSMSSLSKINILVRKRNLSSLRSVSLGCKRCLKSQQLAIQTHPAGKRKRLYQFHSA